MSNGARNDRSPNVSMHVPERLLEQLRCSVTGMRLQPMKIQELMLLNGRITLQRLCASDGNVVERPLQAALVTEDRRRVYPVEDGIPNLLPTASIDISDVDETNA